MFKVSVILPCYNKESMISKTLDSLINQTIFKYLDIVCIDDCSTDNTTNIINKYAFKYINIRLIKNNINKGTYMCRKIGIIAAKANYIGFVDPDDWVENSYFEELYNKAIKNNANIVITKSVKIYYGENKIKKHTYCCPDMNDDTFYNINPNMNPGDLSNIHYCWNMLFNRNVLAPYLTLPNARIIYAEDTVLIITSLLHNGNIFITSTNASYVYNMSKEVKHESIIENKEDKKNVAKSFSSAWLLIDTYLMEYNKLEYVPYIKNIRKSGIKKLSDKYATMFATESFVSKYSHEIINKLTPEDKHLEAEKILTYIDYLQIGI